MPVKRRQLKNHDHPVTPEAIAAYVAEDWLGLHRALGLKPWNGSPLDVGDRTRPEWWDADDWTLASGLAAELKEAAQCQ